MKAVRSLHLGVLLAALLFAPAALAAVEEDRSAYVDSEGLRAAGATFGDQSAGPFQTTSDGAALSVSAEAPLAKTESDTGAKASAAGVFDYVRGRSSETTGVLRAAASAVPGTTVAAPATDAGIDGAEVLSTGITDGGEAFAAGLGSAYKESFGVLRFLCQAGSACREEDTNGVDELDGALTTVDNRARPTVESAAGAFRSASGDGADLLRTTGEATGSTAGTAAGHAASAATPACGTFGACVGGLLPNDPASFSTLSVSTSGLSDLEEATRLDVTVGVAWGLIPRATGLLGLSTEVDVGSAAELDLSVLGIEADAPSDVEAAAAPVAAGVRSGLASALFRAIEGLLGGVLGDDAATSTPRVQTSAGTRTVLDHVTTPTAIVAAGAFLSFLLTLLPLYSRINKEDGLENAKRKEIYEIVTASPGVTISEVARRSGVSHSTAAYHLGRLADLGLAVASGDGNRVRYFRNGGRVTDEERRLLTVLQSPEVLRVYEYIAHHPWCYRAEMAESLSVATPTVNWHLRPLLATGLVQESRNGRNAYLTADTKRFQSLYAGLRSKLSTSDLPVPAALLSEGDARPDHATPAPAVAHGGAA
ncbi:MAG: winged helix-turn-helix transcriptional regulator [Methanobacteriota archaeon]